MKKMIRALLAMLLVFGSGLSFAASNSSPGFYYGFKPTPAQWNTYFSGKLDYIPGTQNSIPYWDASGNLLSAQISGDCTAVADVFTCANVGSQSPATGTFATINGTKLLYSSTAPTISSGFGTSPSISQSNGTASFRVNVGTGGTATSGVVGLPTAATGWNCYAIDFANPAINRTVMTGSTVNTVTLTNYNLSGTATAWAASAILIVSCFAY